MTETGEWGEGVSRLIKWVYEGTVLVLLGLIIASCVLDRQGTVHLRKERHKASFFLASGQDRAAHRTKEIFSF